MLRRRTRKRERVSVRERERRNGVQGERKEGERTVDHLRRGRGPSRPSSDVGWLA